MAKEPRSTAEWIDYHIPRNFAHAITNNVMVALNQIANLFGGEGFFFSRNYWGAERPRDAATREIIDAAYSTPPRDVGEESVQETLAAIAKKQAEADAQELREEREFREKTGCRLRDVTQCSVEGGEKLSQASDNLNAQVRNNFPGDQTPEDIRDLAARIPPPGAYNA